MYTYKRVTECPNSIEVEYYQSIREVGKYYGGRQPRRGSSSARQRAANKARCARKWENIIDCNFGEKDFFCRFSAPYGTFTAEQDFRREARNFFERIKRRLRKLGRELKYIGFIECGKSGKNWHMHIILEREVAFIAQECWSFQNGGVNLTPLYRNHEYQKLAEYIRKDVLGEKRLMASRNLVRPKVTVRKAKRTEIRKLERGEYIEPPEGWYQVEDETMLLISEVTGCSWSFRYRPITYRGEKNRRF